MRKILYLRLLTSFITVCLLLNDLSAQDIVRSDIQKFSSVIKPFKTYTLSVHINGTPAKGFIKAQVNDELRKHFTSLKQKRLTKSGGDFNIIVTVTASLSGPEQYSVSAPRAANSVSDSYQSHQYSQDHVVTADITLASNGRTLMTVNVDSNAIVKRRHSYSETIYVTNFVGDNYSESSIRDRESQRQTENKSGIKEIRSFDKDFFYVFDRYKISGISLRIN